MIDTKNMYNGVPLSKGVSLFNPEKFSMEKIMEPRIDYSHHENAIPIESLTGIPHTIYRLKKNFRNYPAGLYAINYQKGYIYTLYLLQKGMAIQVYANYDVIFELHFNPEMTVKIENETLPSFEEIKKILYEAEEIYLPPHQNILAEFYFVLEQKIYRVKKDATITKINYSYNSFQPFVDRGIGKFLTLSEVLNWFI